MHLQYHGRAMKMKMDVCTPTEGNLQLQHCYIIIAIMYFVQNKLLLLLKKSTKTLHPTFIKE